MNKRQDKITAIKTLIWVALSVGAIIAILVLFPSCAHHPPIYLSCRHAAFAVAAAAIEQYGEENVKIRRIENIHTLSKNHYDIIVLVRENEEGKWYPYASKCIAIPEDKPCKERRTWDSLGDYAHSFWIKYVRDF